MFTEKKKRKNPVISVSDPWSKRDSLTDNHFKTLTGTVHRLG